MTSSLNRPCSQARGRSQAQRWPEYIVDLTLAWVLGILFQFFAIKPMSGLAPRQALARAIRADTLTVVAFEAGLFGWMALMFFVFFPHPHLKPDNAG